MKKVLATLFALMGIATGVNAQQADTLIHWPQNYLPVSSSFFVHNEITIEAPPDVVWQLLIDAENWPQWYEGAADVNIIDPTDTVLKETSVFTWKTMGLKFTSTIKEYQPYTRLSWESVKNSIQGYHAWLIIPTPQGCKLITDESQKGWLTFFEKVFQPNKLRKLHDKWLSTIKSKAEAKTNQLTAMTLTNTDKKRLLNSYGEWAVVTGATSGIGRQIAILLASAGFNIVINARNENALLSLSKELEKNYRVRVKIACFDLSTEAGVKNLITACDEVSIGLLVASAGFGTSGTFITSPIQNEQNMLRVNCEAVMLLTHHFGKVFMSQQRGGIILLSSMVAFQGVPYAAHYAATKAYIQTLAEGIYHELKPYGVDVLAAAPGPVKSGFGERADMKMAAALTVQQVAAPILKALGRRTTVLPGILTKLLVYSLRTVPRGIKVLIMKQVMKGMTQHQY